MSGEPHRYSRQFLEHLMSPRAMVGPVGPDFEPEGVGTVEGSASGASLTVWIAVDAEGCIERFAWRAVGMPQVVAGASALAELVLEPCPGGGTLSLEAAMALTPEALAERLGGLPARKIHETLLGPKALKLAIGDRFKRLGLARESLGGAPAAVSDERLCQCVGVTGGELEQVARAGGTFEDAQALLGVSTGCGTCEPEARALHAWFKGDRPRAGAGAETPSEEV